MPHLLFSAAADRIEPLLPHIPNDYQIDIWPDVAHPDKVDYLIAWGDLPDGLLASCSNLRVVFSLGAGVDHLLNDPDLNDDIPIVRMVEDSLSAGMAEYVTARVLYYHRDFHRYGKLQNQCKWQKLDQVPAGQRRIGIMGLGEMGLASARALIPFEFDLAGLSRRRKDLPGITSFTNDEMDDFLARTDILINCLPITPETDGILNADLFNRLPESSFLIQVGRGEHLVNDDLITALDSGRLAHASLDVFHEEPLPGDHPFWKHSKVDVTPHIASVTDPARAMNYILNQIDKYEAGGELSNTASRSAGY